MTEESTQKLINLLKSIPSDQNVTIEYLTREHLKNNGLSWQSYSEIEAQIELEKFLLQEGLIKDTGKTTKLYSVDSKIKRL